MFSKSVELLSVEALTMGAKGAYLAIVCALNDFNLRDKDSFGYYLQFQHSVYGDHSNTVIE